VPEKAGFSQHISTCWYVVVSNFSSTRFPSGTTPHFDSDFLNGLFAFADLFLAGIGQIFFVSLAPIGRERMR